MWSPCKAILATLLVSLLLTISSRPTIAQEAEDQYEYVTSSPSATDLCNTGKQQSPVALLNSKAQIIPGPGSLQIKYKPSNANTKLINRGHDVSVVWSGDAGSVKINGTNYKLSQTHWHHPSEHTVDGKSFPLEQHIVHMRGKTLAVIGIFFNIGSPHAFLSKLEGQIKTIIGGKNQTNMSIITPKDIVVDNKDFYRYMGSLTIPPCTEGVIWTVSTRVQTVSQNQLKLLRAAIHNENNNRPIQQLNGRKITHYKSKQYEQYADM